MMTFARDGSDSESEKNVWRKKLFKKADEWKNDLNHVILIAQVVSDCRRRDTQGHRSLAGNCWGVFSKDHNYERLLNSASRP